MIPIVVAILGFISVAIPPLARWLERKTGGFSVWKSEITYWAGLPRSVKGQFFGRDDELKKISDSLKHSNAVVLSGGPGIGKSKLAAEFAEKSKRNGFWTPGGETADQTLLSLAPHLGVERGDRSEEEVLVQTRRRLQALPAKTLWVVDNLSNLDLLNTLLSEIGKISILVTSQDSRKVVPAGVEYHPIEVLRSEPATLLLCRTGNYDYRLPIILEIVEEVGRLPRAVEALAVQLELPGQTPENLLEDLREISNPLDFARFQTQTAGLEIPRNESLFNALRGPLDALPPDIREALAPLGYTADSPIPMALAEALTGLSGGELINFFDECTGKSVLSAVEQQVTIHSLTAAAIAATNTDDNLRTALQYAASRLGAIIGTHNYVPTGEIYHYDQMRIWAAQALDQEDQVIGPFSNNLAYAYEGTGRFEDAAQLHQENLEVMGHVLGPEHPDTLTSRNNMAIAYINAGRFEKAVQLHEENLEVLLRVLGPEHPDTLRDRNNLASAFRSAGRIEEAARLHRENLEVMERILGPEHLDTLASRNNLAIAYDNAGRFDEAARLHQENLEYRQRVMGPEHPETLNSRNNLANAYLSAERFDAAIELHQENLEARQRVLGPEHLDTLTSRNNLAAAYGGSGRHEEVIPLFRETYLVRTRVLGPDHPGTLSSRHNLAAAYCNTGQYNQAAQIHGENLKVMERVLGQSTPILWPAAMA
jgi:tetratricopeptide (TPR) repeat protein